MMETKVYAGRLKDRDELLKSSSGGAFTALSDAFLGHDGAVAASVYDYTDGNLKFSLFWDTASRDQARGSKYFQSELNNVFKECKECLQEHPEKNLLFVGTGCQAEAFRTFIESNKLLDRAFIVDIICYGVVSPEIWQKYLKYKLPGEESKYSGLTFKDKRNGWNHPVSCLWIDGKETEIEDYVMLFYSRYALRPSCYKCPYTAVERKTDITIGDFWGIDQRVPNFYDPMGNSLFLVHTQKGQKLFDSICGSLDFIECTAEECMQSHLQHPTEHPQDRARFWSLYRQKGIHDVLKQYATVSFYNKVKTKAKKFLTRSGGHK